MICIVLNDLKQKLWYKELQLLIQLLVYFLKKDLGDKGFINNVFLRLLTVGVRLWMLRPEMRLVPAVSSLSIRSPSEDAMTVLCCFSTSRLCII